MSRLQARRWARERLKIVCVCDGRSPQLWVIKGWQNSRWGCKNTKRLSCIALMCLILVEQACNVLKPHSSTYSSWHEPFWVQKAHAVQTKVLLTRMAQLTPTVKCHNTTIWSIEASFFIDCHSKEALNAFWWEKWKKMLILFYKITLQCPTLGF